MDNKPRNDYEITLQNQRTRCLQTIADLGKRLREQRNQYPNSCENYLRILDHLEKKVSKNKSKNVLDRCEDELSRYWNIISENFSSFNAERTTKPYSRSPDSPATLHNVENNSAETARYVYNKQILDNSNDYRPDSTSLNRGYFGSSNCLNESYDIDNEVSSNKINTPMHVPDDTFPSLYSRRRDTGMDNERSDSEIDDPVQLIMNTVKNRLGPDSMLNQSSLSNYRGISSSEEIERYEGTLKSQFFNHELPTKAAECGINNENKLSSLLEKMMVNRDSSSTSASGKLSISTIEKPNVSNCEKLTILSSEKPNTSILEVPSTSSSEKSSAFSTNAALSISDSSNSKMLPEKNAEILQKRDKPISLREKMAQDIGLLHKAGESNKIHPSLKQLKSDASRSTSPPFKLDVSTRPDDKIHKDKDDYRSKRSSDYRKQFEYYSHSPHSPKSYSRSSSKESPHEYRSPDDYHSSSRKRRSRSRSRDRHRDHYSESSSSDRNSPKCTFKDGFQSKSLESFVNSIGYGRCLPSQKKFDDNQKKDDRNKNDTDESKPNLKVEKKNVIKFTVDTNLPANSIEQIVKKDSVEGGPTPPGDSDATLTPLLRSPSLSPQPLPHSPVYTASPLYSSSPACGESSASLRITPSTDPRFHKINNFNDKRDGFPNGHKIDPRLKQPISKHTDPRIDRHPLQNIGFSKDLRVSRLIPPPLMSLSIHDDVFRPRAGMPGTLDAGFPKDPRVPTSSVSSTSNVNKFRPRVVEQPLSNARSVQPFASGIPRSAVLSSVSGGIRGSVPSSTFGGLRGPKPTSASNVSKENNASYSSFSQDNPRQIFIPPAAKENKLNQPAFSPNKPPPNRNWNKNKFADNSWPFSKKNPRDVFSFEPKNNITKSRSSEDIKEQVKSSNEFLSPLQDIFQTNEVVKTGRGYGEQRGKKSGPKFDSKNFTIPKIRKQSTEVDKFSVTSASSVKQNEKATAFNDNGNRNDCLDDTLESVPTPVKKAIVNATSSAKGNSGDEEDWDSAVSNSKDPSSIMTIQRESSCESRNSLNLVSVDITVDVDDEEECCDPVNSPLVECTVKSATETTSELATKTDTNEDVEVIRDSVIEIDDDDVHSHNDFEDLTQEKNGDEVIEIDDTDNGGDRDSANDLDRLGTSAPNKSCSLETDRFKITENLDLDGASNTQELGKRLSTQNDTNSTSSTNLPPRKNSPTEKKKRFVVESKCLSRNAEQDASSPFPQDTCNGILRDEILKTKLMDYINSLSNPPEISEKDKQLSPMEFIIKLFPKLDPASFMELQAIISRYENYSDNEPKETLSVEPVRVIEASPTACLPPTVIKVTREIQPPKIMKVSRGKKRGKKSVKVAAAKSKVPIKPPLVAEPSTSAEPKPIALAPAKTSRKRGKRTELDRLHADIEKMKHTKNNVLGIGVTRRCRLQPANYSETKSYRRLHDEWMSSESDFDGAIRGGSRKIRSKPDLSSDNDSISSNKRYKSKALISSDDSSDADSGSETFSNASRITSKQIVSDTFDAIRKYKACPRRKKIERFGSMNYEQFEENEDKKDMNYIKRKHCPKNPIPLVPRYPSSCENLDSCVCHNQLRSDITPKSIESMQLKVVNNFFAKMEAKSSPIKSPKKRKQKPGKASKLRMKMSKTGHYPSWQVVKQAKNQKTVFANEGSIGEEHCSLTNASETPSSSVSNSSIFVAPSKSDDDSPMDPSVTEDDANDELKDLPKYNTFKNRDITSIKIATIGVRMCDSALVYICQTNGCAYESVDIAMFALHITFLHKDWKIEAECNTCSNSQKYLNLKTAFRHLFNEHLDINSGLKLTPVLPVQIKEEPQDETPINVRVAEECIQKNDVLIENNVPNFPPVLTAEPSTIFETSIPTFLPPRSCASEKVPMSPQTRSLLKNAPKIRVRRLSGDKLSGPDASSDSQKIRNISEHISHSSSEADNVSAENYPNKTFVNVEKNTATKPSNNRIPSPRANSIITENELNLMQFYKCYDDACGFSSNHKKEFLQHLHTVHKNHKRNKKFDPIYLTCKYCSKIMETPEMLVIHMEKYENCKFQCAYCKFRASRPIFLLWHLNANHRCLDIKILVSSLVDNKEILMARSDQEKDLKDVVAPIKCVHCNNFETISFEEYKHHWKKNHSQTDSFQCSICKASSFSLESSLKHLIFHGYGEFQCVYCIHGAANEDAIRSHLLRDHYTLYPKAVKRIAPKDPETQDKFDDYVEILDLDEPLINLQKHFLVINENKTSTLTSQADTPLGTDAPVLNTDKKYVLNVLDSESPAATRRRRKMSEACSTNGRRTSISESERTNNGVIIPVNVVNESSDCNTGDSNNDDVIAVCSSDDDTTDRLVINEDAPVASTKIANKAAIQNGLSGIDLYKCGFDGCTASFKEYIPFKDHLPTCDNARYRTSPKCPHCNRMFQKNHAFLTHIGLHGIPRYICSLCDNRFTTPKKAEDHIKQHHKVNSFKVLPANPLKNNTHEDLYVVLPNSEKGGGKGNKQYKKFTDMKYLPSTSIATTAKPKEIADTPAAKKITTVYSLQDVERLLPTQLFSEPVTCGICSTYKSKVRQNIIVHLECHSTGLVSVNDITNPVPCTEKSELMFNKMTNHAAFGAKADDKKIKCLIEKMEAYSGDKNEIIPAFIPKTLRFSCGAPDCTYRSTDAARLKSHWETLHSELNFNCPHCSIVIPVEKIHTHLRYHDGRLYKCYYCTKLHFQRQIIENHQLESHPDSPTQIQTIRDLTPEEIEELSREARYQSDRSYIRNTVMYARISLWKCSLCKCHPMMSEELIKTHCMTCHRVSKQYKCCLCDFADNDINEVNKHMNEKHESISQVVVTIYRELAENDENSHSSSNVSSPCKVRRVSQCANSMDGAQSVAGNGSDQNVTNKSKLGSLSRSEIDDSQIAELNHLLIMPLTYNRYRCPFCKQYNTTDRIEMREHLYQEKKYERFVCSDCGTYGVTEDEITRHAETAHGEVNIGKFSEDAVIEKQVEKILDYQQSKFDQVNDQVSIEISSEEESEENCSRISMNSSGERSLVTEFRCPHCSKVCSNSAGLKNHINYVHVNRTKKRKSQSQTPVQIVSKSTTKISPVSGIIVSNVGGVYPCSYCHKEFPSASTIAKHLCVCPKYSNSNDKPTSNMSEIKMPYTSMNEIKVLTYDRVSACSYCGKRCSSYELDDHITMCKTKLMSRVSCDMCATEIDSSTLDTHKKRKHQPMECLICDKILIGSDALDNHVHESLINISGSNIACIPLEKEVVIMCPYCPTGLIGQSYDKYTFISEHITNKHGSVEKPSKKITVKIRNIVRELMESEITLMQSKYHQKQAMKPISLPIPQTETKKKRNVAVKSTSRISTPHVVNIIDDKPASVPKIQRTNSPGPVCSTPKINIVYRNSTK